MAGLDDIVELVDGEEVFYAVAEVLRHVAGVLGEGLRRPLGLPAAVGVLERLRQIPVVEGGKRLNAVGEQLVHEPAVEIEPLRVGLPRAFRKDPRPGSWARAPGPRRPG